MRSWVVGLALLAIGCFPAPRVISKWEFPSGRTVLEVNGSYIEQECGHGLSDDGRSPGPYTRVLGCHRRRKDGTSEILIREGYGCVLLHELCHEERIPQQECGSRYDLCSPRIKR